MENTLEQQMTLDELFSKVHASSVLRVLVNQDSIAPADGERSLRINAHFLAAFQDYDTNIFVAHAQTGRWWPSSTESEFELDWGGLNTLESHRERLTVLHGNWRRDTPDWLRPEPIVVVCKRNGRQEVVSPDADGWWLVRPVIDELLAKACLDEFNGGHNTGQSLRSRVSQFRARFLP